MHSNIASEIWDELRRYISVADREEAADLMVTVLINNDEDVADIRSAFGGDADVRRALAAYSQDTDEQEEDEEDYIIDDDSDEY